MQPTADELRSVANACHDAAYAIRIGRGDRADAAERALAAFRQLPSRLVFLSSIFEAAIERGRADEIEAVALALSLAAQVSA